MPEPEDNPPGKKGAVDDKDEKKESENILKILDELLSHTNSSRRLFLIFIACALFFGPVALVLGGVLLGHPAYNLRHLEATMGESPENMSSFAQGFHLQLVTPNGTVISEMPFRPPHPHSES